MKRLIIEILAVIAFSFALMASCNKNDKLIEECDEWRSNASIYKEGYEQYRIKDSVSVCRVKALEMELSEKDALSESQKSEIKRLKGSKYSKVVEFTELVRTDTMYITDTIAVSDTCISLKTDYYEYIKCGDEVKMITTDTIRQAVTKKYSHKFLWFKWGTDGFYQDIWSSNPYSHFKYDTYVRFE